MDYLNVHAKEADVDTVNFFKREERLGAVREFGMQLARLDETRSHSGFDFYHLKTTFNINIKSFKL